MSNWCYKSKGFSLKEIEFGLCRLRFCPYDNLTYMVEVFIGSTNYGTCLSNYKKTPTGLAKKIEHLKEIENSKRKLNELTKN